MKPNPKTVNINKQLEQTFFYLSVYQMFLFLKSQNTIKNKPKQRKIVNKKET